MVFVFLEHLHTNQVALAVKKSEREERKSSEHFTTVGFNSVKPIGKRQMTIQFLKSFAVY